MQVKDSFFMVAVKGVIATVMCTLISILLFALIIKIVPVGNSVVKPVNQVIKLLGIFLGCFFSVNGKLGFIKGMAIGTVSTVIIYVIFSIISGMGVFDGSFFLDLIFGLIAGAISGIITVNIKK